ncbi:MAG: PAS domain-containing protein [Firmicutes bacterium]|nr:PAS domain-containing protein [Bacillota bacterium]
MNLAAPLFKPCLSKEFWHTFTNLVVSNTSAAIIAIDKKGNVIFFNRQAELVFGKNEQEVLGKQLTSVFAHLAEHEHYLLMALKTGRGMTDVETNFCPYTDREGVFVHSVALVKTALGIDGAIWMRKDFTDLRRFQQEINNAEVQAIVSQIAAGAAHEIRNPLTTARGYLQLAQKKTDSEIAPYIAGALEEIMEIESIIANLLSLFRPRSTSLQFVPLNGLIKKLLRLVENAGLFNNIVIRTILDKHVPLCLLDAKLIKHAILNVLRNAIEAMPNGGSLTVKTSYDTDAELICINISDTGKGIEPDYLPEIIKPFYSTKKQGSGLGLTLANRIIHHHNGSLEIKSTYGQGTSVLLYLPVSQ